MKNAMKLEKTPPKTSKFIKANRQYKEMMLWVIFNQLSISNKNQQVHQIKWKQNEIYR